MVVLLERVPHLVEQRLEVLVQLCRLELQCEEQVAALRVGDPDGGLEAAIDGEEIASFQRREISALGGNRALGVLRVVLGEGGGLDVPGRPCADGGISQKAESLGAGG